MVGTLRPSNKVCCDFCPPLCPPRQPHSCQPAVMEQRHRCSHLRKSQASVKRKRGRASVGLTECTQQSFHLQAPPPSSIRPSSSAPRPWEQHMSPQIHEWSGAPAWLETHIILVSPSNEYPKRTEAAPKHTLEMRGLPAQSQLLPVVSGTGEYSDKRQRQGIQRWEATTDKQVGGYQLGHQTVCEE